MEYRKTVILKNGGKCLLRNAVETDGAEVVDLFRCTHGQTDYLLSYPDEIGFTVEEEGEYLQKKADSDCDIEILAEIGGKVVGFAGIGRVGDKEKVRHRADFGISVDRDFWGLGIGRALTEACIECARRAGYAQLELDAVAENDAALSLYRSVGFVEYGRNPKGFRSRISGWQPLVLMLLDLTE